MTDLEGPLGVRDAVRDAVLNDLAMRTKLALVIALQKKLATACSFTDDQSGISQGTAMSIPVMRMGLIGFSAEQHEYLSSLVKTRSVRLQWQAWPFMDADAMWVNGARAQSLRSGLVRIPAAEPTSRATQLNLREVDRPLAFTLPLGSPDIVAPYTFDPHSAESVRAVLEKFEAWMHPVAIQLALAEAIAAREGTLTSRIYHLTLHGSLVAIVNLGAGVVGFAPSAGPDHFARADWSGRPSSAHAIPDLFVRVRMSEMMWQYAVRTTNDLLPARYRASSIYFRRSPTIPQRLLKDTHLVLLRELASAPRIFQELQERTGLGDEQLARALAALYYVGSITSDQRRAAAIRPVRTHDQGDPSAVSIAPSLLEADSRLNPDGKPQWDDWTVPAPLSQQR